MLSVALLRGGTHAAGERSAEEARRDPIKGAPCTRKCARISVSSWWCWSAQQELGSPPRKLSSGPRSMTSTGSLSTRRRPWLRITRSACCGAIARGPTTLLASARPSHGHGMTGCAPSCSPHSRATPLVSPSSTAHRSVRRCTGHSRRGRRITQRSRLLRPVRGATACCRTV